ncbi:MAG: outer membrane beta-barrel protein [Flavisolibacter sp.]|nr:outer membrane beta-barrel protein [Flavisolibacter sp.]
MKGFFLMLLGLNLMLTAFSQITKNNWLVGGGGSGAVYKTLDEKSHYLQISPNIGYLFINKIAAGLKLSYVYDKRGLSTFSSKKTGFYFGPFARYYFLDIEQPFNILLEGSYQHGAEKVKGYNSTPTKYSLNSFSFAAGPAIYFNNCVGLEFLAGYAQSQYTNEDFHRKQFQISIGLQVHLEKE